MMVFQFVKDNSAIHRKITETLMSLKEDVTKGTFPTYDIVLKHWKLSVIFSLYAPTGRDYLNETFRNLSLLTKYNKYDIFL